MRSSLSLLLLATTSAAVGFAEAQRPFFSLFLKAERTVVAAGSTVQVKCLITNKSGHTVSVRERSSMEDYRIEVWDAEGLSVSETELGRTLRDVSKGGVILNRNFVAKVKSGATYEDTIDVSAFYEMQNAGKYRIRVQRELPKELGQGVVKSNTISVTVAP